MDLREMIKTIAEISKQLDEVILALAQMRLVHLRAQHEQLHQKD
jgi:hypothetical protein